MRTVSYRLADLQRAVIPIGYCGENEHTRVIFDCKRVFDEYPSAVSALTVQPPAGEAYPAVIVRDGDSVYWDVFDSDLAEEGRGEAQLTFSQGEVVVKSIIFRTFIDRSIMGEGEIPEPLDDFLTRAGETLTAIPETIQDTFGEISAEAETLPAGSSATAEFDSENMKLSFGIPAGEKGDTGPAGADGAPGQDGAPGKDGADGAPGKDGKDGKDGADGYTPVKGTDYWTVEDKAEIVAAAAAEAAGEVIDDTAGDGDTNKTWSADKLSDLNGAINAKYTKPETGIPATDLASGVIPIVHNVPSGGTTDQVLAKNSNNDYDLKWVNQSGGGSGMTDEEKLLQSNLPGTVQTVTFTDSKPSTITHTSSGSTVRTDVFTWGTGTVSETRTLANGKYITITTNLTTLETTVSAVQEAA